MSRALSFREAVLLVARREFIQRARDRSFFVSTAITIGIIVLVIVFPKALNFGADEYNVAFLGPDGAAVQRAAQDQAELGDVDLAAVAVDNAQQAEQMVLDGDLDAYLDGDSVVVERELSPSLRVVLENAHSSVAGTQALTDAGLDPDQVATALDTAELRTVTLDPAADERNTRGTIAFIGALVLYGQLLGYGFWVALGVVEEKSSRVVEVLLSAIPARALLAGKVLGIGVLGLAQLFVIAAVSVAAAALVGSIAFEASMLQPILLVLGWFVLGYIAYACLSAAAAARVSRQEELQNATTPLTMLAMVSFFASFYVFFNSSGTGPLVVSVIPPVSALAMPIRMARGDAAVWEIGLALILMLGLIAALIVVAGRIYEGAVLRMGAKVPLADAWRSGRRVRG
ncbi:MAG TPA: ABC transporter permease [Jiangellaceae bacterium]|jgi:ABC-2 type transport system permease protein|nr:ABC transporter permease [Jiangellaceae bacterium]